MKKLTRENFGKEIHPVRWYGVGGLAGYAGKFLGSW